MTGAEHYDRAGYLVSCAHDAINDAIERHGEYSPEHITAVATETATILQAQVHATLALAVVTAGVDK